MMLNNRRQSGDDLPAWEPWSVLQTASVSGSFSESSGNDDEEPSSMTDEEKTLLSYRKTSFARSFAQLMCLTTPTRRGKTSLQAQRRVAKAKMITRPSVFYEASAWYYATPRARAKVGRQLRIRHRFSGRSLSDDDGSFPKTGKSISKAELLSSNGRCNTKANIKVQPSRSWKGNNTIKPSCKKNLFL